MAEFIWWLWQFIWRQVRFLIDIALICLPLAIFLDYVFPAFTAAHHLGIVLVLAIIGYNFHRAVVRRSPLCITNEKIDGD